MGCGQNELGDEMFYKNTCDAVFCETNLDSGEVAAFTFP